ncbi:hypothetical protein BDV38DRAFT_3283 [Aspergillus pseudotamarii]|uniref:Uncharacterized protein n=1 Tax=Aspergillus pseudotamarii TaxID=132259 RepID=A0A5N6TBX9_ASPPS|nr:uncharacterized protein BDV38DRAFT_3283 [Aspergillus pseudotamarii]KAE8143780.1 hypothetical protein BDV38DRAFT_3283 [Aspergillus pseudotamarii]
MMLDTRALSLFLSLRFLLIFFGHSKNYLHHVLSLPHSWPWFSVPFHNAYIATATPCRCKHLGTVFSVSACNQYDLSFTVMIPVPDVLIKFLLWSTNIALRRAGGMTEAGIITTCIPTLYRIMSSLALGVNRAHIPEELELISSKKCNWAGSGSHVVSPTGPSSQSRKGGRLKALHYPREVGERENKRAVQKEYHCLYL